MNIQKAVCMCIHVFIFMSIYTHVDIYCLYATIEPYGDCHGMRLWGHVNATWHTNK